MKNFNLLFLFLVILFVSTEAAPKGGGRGGGGRGGGRSGGRGRGYGGGGGGGGYYGGGDGEFPVWAIILICVVSVLFVACVVYACCIEEDDDYKDDSSNVQSAEHENKIPNENDKYWLHPIAPSLEQPQVNSVQISDSSAQLPYSLNPIQASQFSNLHSDQLHNHTARY